jgi:hypothetical protein
MFVCGKKSWCIDTGLDISLGVCIDMADDVSQVGIDPYSSQAQKEKPSWIVAGLGFMGWEVGVVQVADEGVLMPSGLVHMSSLFMVIRGVGGAMSP